MLSLVSPVSAQPSDIDKSCGTKSGLCWPRLKPGARGFTVETLQKLLNIRGSKLKIDGTFGASTTRAVKNFQTQYKLKVDGIVGYQTWENLVPTLKRGNKGQKVLLLQQLMWSRNYSARRDEFLEVQQNSK